MTHSRIDAHVHLGTWQHRGFFGLAAAAEEIATELRRAGVSGVALTTTDQADNRALIQVARSFPLDLWLFLWARPGDAGLAALLQQHRPLVRGLKLHPSLERLPLDDRRWDPVLELADAHGLALMVHTGRWQETAGFPLALARARAWPRLTFILSHAGGDTPELCLAAAAEVRRLRLTNVFFDTAGLREGWALARALQVAGAEHYLMGSDYPLAHPSMYIAGIEALRLPTAVEEGLLGDNARRVLGAPCPTGTAATTTPGDLPVRALLDVSVTSLSTATEPMLPAPTTAPEASTTPEAPLTVLITGAGGPIGVNLTRSLRLARRPLRLLGTDANLLHRPLALTDRCLPLPRCTAADYLERLNAIVAAESVDLVLPTHPAEVQALCARRDRVAARLFLPPLATVALAADKHRTWERLQAAGVPVPRSRRIDGEADIRQAFAELGPPPIWFRGSGSPGVGIGVASLPCREPEHARAWVDHHAGWGGFMASEYLPGDNLTWLGVWHRGTLWGSQTRERLEYVIPHVSPSGITGAPAVTRTVHRPEVRALGEAAVRALDDAPHGVFFVDLKADAAGQPRVTEVNAGRFGTTLHFYTVAGFNFPALAVELALDRPPAAPVHEPIPAGTYWLRTLDCGPVLLDASELPTE